MVKRSYKHLGKRTRNYRWEGPEPAQVAEHVLRPYLVHHHHSLAKDYPVLATMAAEEAANHLIQRRRGQQIQVCLRINAQGQTECKISGDI